MSLPTPHMPTSVLFDMDGVLVDTSSSYLQAILATARKHVEAAEGAAGGWLRAECVATLKEASGFNNDWHLTEAIVRLALAPEPYCDPSRLADTLTEASVHGTGLQALRSLLGADEGPLPDTDTMPPLVRSFQSAYLGRELMERLHPDVPFDVDFPEGGFIRTERLLVNPETLVEVTSRAQLAIASGRPREEALFALAFHRMEVFAAVVAHDDVRAEERRRPMAGPLGKPSPWPLREALRRIDCEAGDCLGYLGDLPDDMRAAVGAGVPGIGIETDASPSALRRAGAMRTFPKTDDALRFLLDPLRA